MSPGVICPRNYVPYNISDAYIVLEEIRNALLLPLLKCDKQLVCVVLNSVEFNLSPTLPFMRRLLKSQ